MPKRIPCFAFRLAGRSHQPGSLQPKSIARSFARTAVLAIAIGWVTFAATTAQEAKGVATILAGAGQWTEAPAYLDLFVAPVHRAAYRAYVSSHPLDTVLERLTDTPALLHPPGAWQARALGPIDAFGGSGPYNRWSLARVYGSTPARVAHGPRADSSQVVESWTLVSPYPDSSLSHLEPGTLLLVGRVPPL